MNKAKIISTPRGRMVSTLVEGRTHFFSFKYAYEGQEAVCNFHRQYPLCGRLIDAVIDNHQIKEHRGIILPRRAA